MRVRVLVVVVLSCLLGHAAAAQPVPVPTGWQMERAILVSRHGVRAPTKPNDEIASYAASAWPEWPVATGELTPRGAELMQVLGRYYRLLYGGLGLVEENICPPPNTVVAWTDAIQRTRASGAALLSGMYPRCPNPLLVSLSDPSAADPLFHPQPTPACPMDAARDRAAILDRLGGSFDAVEREYGPELSRMQQVLCPPGAPAGCGLGRRHTTIEPAAPGRLHLKGPIAVGGFAAETFLMESATGLPAGQVAWGRLSGDGELRGLLKIHRLEMDLLQKTLPIARQHGSTLLNQVVAALLDGHDFPGLPRRAEPIRFGLLVGHDTNLANLARLLNVGWQVAGFEANDASPGGALAFELFHDTRAGSPTRGRRFVRLTYIAQTFDQLRNVVQLDARTPPAIVAVPLPACAADAVHGACPFERFVAVAREAIEPACVMPVPAVAR
jgi:4-phytase/acid phosphatase